MDLTTGLSWLQQTRWATAIRQDELLFPFIESIHVLAIAAVIGTIAIVDLRLMGLNSRDRRVSAIMQDVLPFTRGAFLLALLSGGLLFASHALDYMHKAPFVAKMLLLGLAFINIGIFHFLIARSIATWDSKSELPMAVRSAGAVSLSLWIAVVACGRWIGFV